MLHLEFVPDLWKNEQRQKLSDNLKKILDVTLDDVENQSTEVLLEKLKSADLEFSHYEQFGDLLLKFNTFEAEDQKIQLAKKAIVVYETAQQENKIFSFGLIRKINKARALL
jgi:5-methylthioribose kinase